MRWQFCAELVFIMLVFSSAFGAGGWATAALIKAFRVAKPLRESRPLDKIADRSALTPEQKADIERHWQNVRERIKAYGEDLGRMALPLRRDTFEFVKEASQWGRLGIQYAIVGNAGALAALPYLLSWQKTNSPATPLLTVGDATWSAIWFAGGLFSAAVVCAIAYCDFQVNAAIGWNDLDVEYKLVLQRHYDTEIDGQELPLRQQIRAELRVVTVRTSIAGLYLALIAWFGLAWGAIRLISSLQS